MICKKRIIYLKLLQDVKEESNCNLLDEKNNRVVGYFGLPDW
ncbi:MAG: hypothetical protein REI96_00520 [Flavobacterium nitrogenifigens]|nr:hypothetical protein [Flavobacterium nitrogenifigens]MDQ8010900.1 hypothetical protein [Flavobacterium nitrogenifigens]